MKKTDPCTKEKRDSINDMFTIVIIIRVGKIEIWRLVEQKFSKNCSYGVQIESFTRYVKVSIFHLTKNI